MDPKLENMTGKQLLLVSVLGGPEMEAQVDDELERRALASLRGRPAHIELFSRANSPQFAARSTATL